VSDGVKRISGSKKIWAAGTFSTESALSGGFPDGRNPSAHVRIVLQNSKIPPQQNSRESELTPSLG
jgi:hypothetical protein